MPAEVKPPYGDMVLVRDRDQLRDARETAGVPRQQVATAAGMSTAAIGHLETGLVRWTSLDKARAIASSVGRDLTDLFDTSQLGLAVRDGAVLRAAREAVGLSRKTLGEAIGVSSATIDQLENGKRALLWRAEAEKLAQALARDVMDLFAEQVAVPA